MKPFWIMLIAFAGLGSGARGQTLPTTAPATQAVEQGVMVKGFRFTGNTAYTSERLAAVVGEYTGRSLTFEQLDDARRKVTDFYVGQGYTTSGALLPEQTIEEGIVWIHVVEGKLEKLQLTGNQGLSLSYFTDRLGPALGSPLKMTAVQQAMEVLQQDPRIAALQGRVSPGSGLGLAVFDLNVVEARPYQIGLQFDNQGTPSTGAERAAIVASHLNLTGVGDTLAVRYGPFTGGVRNPEWAPANDISIFYARPILGDRTRVSVSYERNDMSLIEPPLSDLGSDTVTDSLSLAVQQTLLHTPQDEVNVTLALSRKDNETKLMGEGFSFSEGAVDGLMVATALRATLEWTSRSDTHVITARSTLSIGLDALGATIHGKGVADSQFIAWLMEMQGAWKLPWECTLLTRGALQLADDHLLAVEQYTLGGMETVRGYRESALLTDNAVTGSLELRRGLLAWNRLTVDGAVFTDFGYGWDHGGSGGGTTLMSVGCGVLVQWTSQVRGEVYYGYPLFNRGEGDNLQDVGIHFRLLLTAF